MKNQYFGDVNDYRKYGLLRILSDGGKLKIGVCWMLTGADVTGHGGKSEYLDRADKWRKYDPVLFDCLHGCVRDRKARDLCEAEKLGLVPSAIYCTEQLDTDRSPYFSRMLERFEKTDMIFFDPDNGIEVPSMKRPVFPKYLFWQELCDAFNSGKSVLVYQHFPRKKHEPFAREIANQIRQRTNAIEIYSFLTDNVVFFLAAQTRHQVTLRELSKKVKETWNGQIRPQTND